eukprot:g6762.t1
MATYKTSVAPTDKKENNDKDVGDDNNAPKYTDTDKLGASFLVCIIIYAALIFGGELGFGTVWKIVGQNVIPMSKVCECPVNAQKYGTNTIYYSGCVDNTTAEFQAFNGIPKNQSISVEGWFFSSSFTRETARKKKMEANGEIGPGLGDMEPPYLYRCPVFRPWWWNPVDWVGVLILIVSQLLMLSSVATSFIIKTEVYVDRVEVTYYGGNRMCVPLYAIQGELKKHELKGCLPVRESALSLTTTETVAFLHGANGGGTATVILEKNKKDGKTKTIEFRVEPKDPEAFTTALAEARAKYGAATTTTANGEDKYKPQHFYYNEMPPSSRYITDVHRSVMEDEAEKKKAIATALKNEEHTWAGKSTCGYWFRAFCILVVIWLFTQFGVRFLFYCMRELLDPNRPKAPDEFSKVMFMLDYESIAVILFVIARTITRFVNGLPTKAAITHDSLYFHLDRVSKFDSDCADWMQSYDISLIAPREATVSAQRWNELGTCEQVIRFFFTEVGTPVVKASYFYTTKHSKKQLVVKKIVAKDALEGKEIEVNDGFWQFLIHGTKEGQEKILNALINN